MAYGTVNADVVQSSVSGVSLGAGDATMMKNRIINGAMVIDQRNAGASVTVSTATYCVDRWGFSGSQASKFTAQQNAGSVTPPVGFSNYWGLTTISPVSLASGDYFVAYQVIEGYNVADFGWGTANAKTVTISAWVYSSLTGTFGGSLRSSTNNYSYPFTYSIPVANTWTQISITIPGATSSTWNTTNGQGILVNFALGVGSTYSGTAGSWSANNYLSATGATSVVSTNGATFYITGVQLEVGSSATGFEYRQYQQELALCQRYCFVPSATQANGAYLRFGVGANQSSTISNIAVNIPVTMRAIPSLTIPSPVSLFALYTAGSLLPATGLAIAGDGTSPQVVTVSASVAGAATNGYAAGLLANGNNTAYLILSAEL